MSFYGVGCGGDDDDDDDDALVMDDPADQPPDDQPPGDQPPGGQLPKDQPPGGQPPRKQPPGGQPPKDQPPENLVSYSADIQPIFTANCAFGRCHAANAPSGLVLTSYAELVKGGNGGPAFVPEDSANSLIVNRLEDRRRGRVRMPLGGGPLGNDQIQAIKDWIDEGGKDN